MTKTPNPQLCQLKTNRDILLFEFPNNQLLVVACDSSGGIGPKPLDKLKVNGFILGKFTARAALMEVLSTGATPICIVDALGVEPNPSGTEILAGIREEARLAGLDPQLAVTGSTEKNIIVEQTAVDIHKSAGPSTVLLVTIPKDKFTALQNSTIKPANLVATLSK